MRRSFISDMGDLLRQARQGQAGSDLIQLTTEQDKVTLANLVKAIHDRMRPVMSDPASGSMIGGTFDGYDLKQISQWISSAKRAARAAQARGDVSGQLVPYIERLQQSFKDMISAANPGAYERLKAADAAWAQYKIVEDASTARGGEAKPFFSPAAGQAAVRRSAIRRQGEQRGKTLLGKGQAQGQKLSDAASRVLSPKIRGESPTAEAMFGLGELSGDVLTGGIDPVTGVLGSVAQGILGNIVGQKVFYSRPFQKWLQNNYLRGESTIPFTSLRTGPAMTMGLPLGMEHQQRSKEYADEQMLAELKKMGIAPELIPGIMGK
ncbi:MAG: hypothetical protein HRJ53_08855 [Acidobacteria bacterium Pan2503]|uniref:Uncharacterized protein n=1 Tax=Candidatus Acidiferrum panamense TaxID=2741543 RepID=A0A7V8NPS4_9BACT|nr:hypothetical protein [Candidatus Acidoferrum panamensis]